MYAKWAQQMFEMLVWAEDTLLALKKVVAEEEHKAGLV